MAQPFQTGQKVHASFSSMELSMNMMDLQSSVADANCRYTAVHVAQTSGWFLEWSRAARSADVIIVVDSAAYRARYTLALGQEAALVRKLKRAGTKVYVVDFALSKGSDVTRNLLRGASGMGDYAAWEAFVTHTGRAVLERTAAGGAAAEDALLAHTVGSGVSSLPQPGATIDNADNAVAQLVLGVVPPSPTLAQPIMTAPPAGAPSYSVSSAEDKLARLLETVSHHDTHIPVSSLRTCTDVIASFCDRCVDLSCVVHFGWDVFGGWRHLGGGRKRSSGVAQRRGRRSGADSTGQQG
jgi:hypothetical protein